MVAFLPLLETDAREEGEAEKATRRALCLSSVAAIRAARRVAADSTGRADTAVRGRRPLAGRSTGLTARTSNLRGWPGRAVPPRCAAGPAVRPGRPSFQLDCETCAHLLQAGVTLSG